MSSITQLEFEEKNIRLELREIELKRRLNEIENEKMEHQKNGNDKPSNGLNSSTLGYKSGRDTQLNYAPSIRKNLMRIADVRQDGSIGIYGKNESIIQAKQYNVQSLKWICKKLPRFAERQRVEKKFFDIIAQEYSRKFTKISNTTMEKLCYLVDSGEFDIWFTRYDNLKSKQSKLME